MTASGSGICISVVQGAAFVVRDRLLRVPDTTKLSDDIYQNAECSIKSTVPRRTVALGLTWIRTAMWAY